jgi:hypothetical protein
MERGHSFKVLCKECPHFYYVKSGDNLPIYSTGRVLIRGVLFLNVESVSAILKEGMAVSTKLGSGMTWCRNIVYKSERNCVCLALIEQYLENIIIPGSTISIKYVDEYFIYLFEGTIINISASYPPYLTVRITNAEEIINSRLSPRYDVYMAADLKPGWDDTSYFAVITDISFGGLAFICNLKLDYNEELEITAYLPKGLKINTKGKIIRKTIKNNVIDYSMQFIEINESNCNLLSKYFSSLESEISLLYKQYLSDVKGKI